jgi:radical SAM protein with 4Fe4S-binding SPASM domain
MRKWQKICKPVFKDEFFRWPYKSKPDKISWYQISGQSSYCGITENTSTVDFEPAKRRLCRNAFSLNVLSDGRVTACPFDVEGEYSLLGNIKESTLLEIWQSSIAKTWRDNHFFTNFNKVCYCKKCHDWYKIP